MEALCASDPIEAHRRVAEHVRIEVMAAGSKGLTKREMSVLLGMDPSGVDDGERLYAKAARGAS